jgi:hypothetical protein
MATNGRDIRRTIGSVDVMGVHKDLAGYYRAFGLLDSSTASGLFDRVVWPNLTAAKIRVHHAAEENAVVVVGGGDMAVLAVDARAS